MSADDVPTIKLPTDSWRRQEEILEAFEAAWRAGRRPEIDDYLSAGADPRPMLVELILSDIECRLIAGLPRPVEDYLARYPELAHDRHIVLRLIEAEIHHRRRSGQEPVAEDYQRRFPEYYPELRGPLGAGGDGARGSSPGPLCPACGMAVPLAPGSAEGEGELDCDRCAASFAPDPDRPGVWKPEPLPRLGRYRLIEEIGRGAFGVVYRARDIALGRVVAVKVPHPGRLDPQAAEALRREARAAARLQHPGIVEVYDIGTDGGRHYIAYEFVSGMSLRRRLERGRLQPGEAAELAARVAEALYVLHRAGCFHRDIKPENILLDDQGRPLVTDFGLAVQFEELPGERSRLAGTLPYMAPELVRGEGHRIDGRADIYSLGVVLYEVLCGRRPFAAAQAEGLIDQILNTEARPLREIDEAIPRELERIALKAMSKRIVDRYTVARDLADDLRQALAPPAGDGPAAGPAPDPSPAAPGERPEIAVVPKGLQSFDGGDKDFFMALLPGPRDRNGLPPSVRFWKARIEAEPPDEPFAVGLLHGPSGCGKTSLLRAGVIPRLGRRIVTAYVDCIAEGTEARLARALRRVAVSTSEGAGLVELMAAIRRGDRPEGKVKLLIVLDQFEQWLSAHAADMGRTELALALRQCDGENLQCLLAVRQEFFLSAGRLFDLLELGLSDQHNLQLLDLISEAHALEVLRMFGWAYGRLPARHDDITPRQETFLARAIGELQTEGRVVCVRLSLFAEMMKDRAWEPASLDQVAGVAGVGTAFLRETFVANPGYRPYRREVQRLLRALLPREDEPAIAARRPRSVLIRESGMERNPELFDRICEFLDVRLHLITPSGPEDAATEVNEPSYQFIHDYLVPSVRDFLDSERLATGRGRAEILLERRTGQWTRHREDRFLPSFGEYVRILRHFPRGGREPNQRAMMRRATRYFSLRAAVMAAVTSLIAWGAWEVNGRYQAHRVVGQILAAKPSTLRRLISRDLPPYRRWADRLLVAVMSPPARWEDLPEEEKSGRLRASLALAPIDGAQAGLLRDRLLDSPEDGMFRVIRASLSPSTPGLIPWLEAASREPKRPEVERLRAGLALATFAQGEDKTWTEDLLKFLAARLLGASPEHQVELREDLALIRRRLVQPLSETFLDVKARDAIREGAARMILEFASDRPDLLADLACRATPEQYAVLLPRLTDPGGRDAIAAVLATVARKQPEAELSEAGRIGLGRRRADAAILLVQIGHLGPALDIFDIGDDPEALTQFVHRSRDRGLRPAHLLDWLRSADQQPARSDAVRERARFALLLALGEFAFSEIPELGREGLVEELVASYAHDPRSTIHSATGWLLRHWGFGWRTAEVDRTPVPYDPTGRRQWFVQRLGSECLTFVVFPAAPDGFIMGSPYGEKRRGVSEVPHEVRLTRPFAISDREMPLDQWIAFISALKANYPRKTPPVGFEIKRLGSSANRISWNYAVTMCRFLTELMGLPESDQAYDESDEFESDSSGFPLNWPCRPERPGFRLPSEAEWEYACRAGTRTAFGFGNDQDLLDRYGWVWTEGSDRFHHPPGLLRPNLRGLFDMHGNLYEWCNDWYDDYPDSSVTDPSGADRGQWRINRGGSYLYLWQTCRSASRNWNAFNTNYTDTGIRIVRTLPTPPGGPTPTPRPQVVARALKPLRRHADFVTSAAFSPDGSLLASCGNDGKILIFRVADGRVQHILPANVSLHCVGFSRDGTILASGNYHGDLQIWRMTDGSLLASIPEHGDDLSCLAFSPDGTMVAAGGNDRRVALRRTSDWALIRRLELPEPKDTSPNGVAFSPDGAMIAAAFEDGNLRIWRVADGRHIKTLEECKSDVNCVAFSPDGTLLAAGSEDRKIRLWRAADWKVVRESVAIRGTVTSLAFSPDGAILVTSSSDRKIRFWSVPDFERLSTVSGADDRVNCLAISPDGTLVANGDSDGTIKLWRLERSGGTVGPPARKQDVK
jgi:eukaryotic-like serine/threonine-protein kinase